jgi:predicted nucleic acid-binding protein
MRVQMSHAIAPVLWQFEVASALHKTLKDGRLSQLQADSFLALLSTLDIRLAPSPPGFARLPDLAKQFKLSIYDAAYLDLALVLLVPIATLDQDLADAARTAGVVCLLGI